MTSSGSSTVSSRERNALLVLNAVSGFGNRWTLKLIEYFGSASAVLASSVQELSAATGLPQAAILNLKHFSQDEFLKHETEYFERHNARVMTFQDEDYPQSLRDIPDRPIVLYLQGSLPEHLDCALAIVGSRHASLYGMGIAETFALRLAELGIPIVSGLAKGIDAAAHRGCLKAGGQTVAVLGCGLDVTYPSENEELYEAIRTKGCLMSEFPFGTPPTGFNFPRRNRIVSGLSIGVVVVEANIKSGALITAEFALDQGKDVFAIPGRIDHPLSAGPLALVKQGAKVVMSLEDILEEIPVKVEKPGMKSAQGARPEGLDDQERQIFNLLQEGVSTFEELETRTGLGPPSLMGPLLSLQLQRLIRERPGKVYEVIE